LVLRGDLFGGERFLWHKIFDFCGGLFSPVGVEEERGEEGGAAVGSFLLPLPGGMEGGEVGGGGVRKLSVGEAEFDAGKGPRRSQLFFSASSVFGLACVMASASALRAPGIVAGVRHSARSSGPSNAPRSTSAADR
jgi:hypothetical protein